MAKPDLLLGQERISVIGGEGPAVEDGTERGDIELQPEEDTDHSIAINADRANMVLGTDLSGPPGIRLDGHGIERDEADYDPGGTQIGVYADFEKGAPLIDLAAAFSGIDLTDSAGIELGNAPGINPQSDAEEVDGALVINQSGKPGTMFGGASMRIGNDEQPGRIEVTGGSGSTFSMETGSGTTVECQPGNAAVTVGGPGEPGKLVIRDGNAETVGFVEAVDGTLTIRGPDKATAMEVESGGTVSFPNMGEEEWQKELPL